MQRLVDGERRRGGEQRVAVRRGARDQTGGDIAAGAAAVLDHHGLMQPLRQALPDQTGQRVGEPPGAKADDQRDFVGRVGLELGPVRQSRPEPLRRRQKAWLRFAMAALSVPRSRWMFTPDAAGRLSQHTCAVTRLGAQPRCRRRLLN